MLSKGYLKKGLMSEARMCNTCFYNDNSGYGLIYVFVKYLGLHQGSFDNFFYTQLSEIAPEKSGQDCNNR